MRTITLAFLSTMLALGCGAPVESTSELAQVRESASPSASYFHVRGDGGSANLRDSSGGLIEALPNASLVVAGGTANSRVSVLRWLPHSGREFVGASAWIHSSLLACDGAASRTWCAVVSADGLANVRTEPSGQASILRTLMSGDWVSVTEEKSGWRKIGSIAPKAGFTAVASGANIHVSQLTKEIPGADGGFPPSNPLEVSYLSQRNNAAYQSSSCGVTSVAMLLNFQGNQSTPDELRRKYAGGGNPSAIAMPENFQRIFIKEQGFGWSTRSGTYADIRRQIDAGRPVVIHTWLTYSGHVVLVVGYDSTGLFVNDPWGRWDAAADSYMSTYGKKVHYRYSDLARLVPTIEGNYSPILGYEGDFWLSTGSRSEF